MLKASGLGIVFRAAEGIVGTNPQDMSRATIVWIYLEQLSLKQKRSFLVATWDQSICQDSCEITGLVPSCLYLSSQSKPFA